MVPLLKRTLDKGLEINERVAASVFNGFDWVFNRDELVKSGQTHFELVHQGDPMAVRTTNWPAKSRFNSPTAARCVLRASSIRCRWCWCRRWR